MNFLPDDIVPSYERDGVVMCRQLIGLINFYIELYRNSGLSQRDYEKMFAIHSVRYRQGALRDYERAIMCALATMISGSRLSGPLFRL